MLNEERVILMTRMASYEAGEGKKNVKIGNYFRSDYIAVKVLSAIISATIVFGAGLALYIFYDFEEFMKNLYNIDLLAYAKNILIYYAGFVGSYAVLTYIVYTYRHAKAKRSLKRYYQNLKKLNSLYDDGRTERRTAGGRK